MIDLGLQALDLRVRIRSDIPDPQLVLPRLFGAFPEARAGTAQVEYELTRCDTREARYELFCDGSSIQRVDNAGSMVDWIVADIGRRALMTSRSFVAVHAATASLGGVGVVLSAPPDHGKTTTVLGLALAGWEVLSDEAALVSPADGSIHAFPRPLMLSSETLGLFPTLSSSFPPAYEAFRRLTHHVAFADLPAGRPGAPFLAACVVLPRFQRGSPTSLEPLSRAETLTALVDQCFNLRAFGGAAMAVLGRLVRDADCYRLTIGDLTAAVNLLGGLVQRVVV